MADITYLVTGKAHVWDVIDQHTAVASTDITVGQPINLTSSGTWQLADANASGKYVSVYIATRTAKSGEPLTGARQGMLDGLSVASLANNADVFLSDTAGALADAAGTNSYKVGVVLQVPGVGPTGTLDKVIKFNCPV